VRGGKTRYGKASGEDNGQLFVEIGTKEKSHLSKGPRDGDPRILEQNLKTLRAEKCATRRV
jgi:hypothetical protein